MNFLDKRVYNSSSIKTTGGTIKLKHRKLFLTDTLKKNTTETVAMARAKLESAIAKMDGAAISGEVRSAMTKFFKSGGGSGDVGKVKGILVLTSNGINGDFGLKVAYVNRAYIDKGDDVKDIEGYVRGGNVGDIHVSPEVMRGDRAHAALTFIHEATHKFADTDDFDERGYMHDDSSDFRQPGITNAECLKNADSYAHFVMAIGD